MNKEIVQKYQKEFSAWLDDPDAIKIRTNMGWVLLSIDNDWDFDYPVVLNDEYVELRQALADGKIIEFNYGNAHCPDWQIPDPQIPIETYAAQCYRIKSEFEIGDWVIDTDTYQISILKTLNLRSNHPLIKWKPIKNDWCWFWDDEGDEKILRRYHFDKKPYIHTDIHGTDWARIEPFIGTLPQGYKE